MTRPNAAMQSPVEGNQESSIRVVAYVDLQCVDCAVYRRMMDRDLLPNYGERVAFEHRDFPLPKHSWALPAAIAGRFFDTVDPVIGVQYRRETLAELRSITDESFSAKLMEFAASQSIPPREANASLDSPELRRIVQNDLQEGMARGVVRTPTVFVNSKQFIETFSFEELSSAIDSALASGNA